MTTTVNRVYVDAEGVVRMSPTGWPEEKELNGITGHITMAENQAALQKAKEESIPFEDKKTIEKMIFAAYAINTIGRGLLYTIEPIQVELQHQYSAIKNHIDHCHWYDCSLEEYNTMLAFNDTSRVRIVARIVTEEEKPELNRKDQIKNALDKYEGNYHWCTAKTCACMGCVQSRTRELNITIEEYVWYLEKKIRQPAPPFFRKYKGALSDDELEKAYNAFCKEWGIEPAPVVDKPEEEEIWMEAQDIVKNRLGTYSNDLICDLARWAIEALKERYVINYIGQQPTEWIPVSAVDRYPAPGKRVLCKLDTGAHQVGYWFDGAWMYCARTDSFRLWGYEVTHFLYIEPLPEPPKP